MNEWDKFYEEDQKDEYYEPLQWQTEKEDKAEAERLYPTNIKTQKCVDCGRLLLTNEYGGLYCPKCFDGRIQEMVESTKGGYY